MQMKHESPNAILVCLSPQSKEIISINSVHDKRYHLVSSWFPLPVTVIGSVQNLALKGLKIEKVTA